MSVFTSIYQTVSIIDTTTPINDKDVNSKSNQITNNLMIKTRILSNNFNFDDKNLNSVIKTTDIKSNQYEGGLKIWECSVDLAQSINSTNLIKLIKYLSSNNNINVLELGCGHSLPSISFILSVMSSKDINTDQKQNDIQQNTDIDLNNYNSIKINLTLQDLNKDVLKHITVPNLWINCKEWIHSVYFGAFNAISGDWRDNKLCNNLGNNNKYNIIFASETIYNESMIEITFNLLLKLLSKPNGICFISAKSYYFGIGGGIQSLKLYLKQNNIKYPFDINTIKRIDDGMSNKREIVVITWKDQCQWSLLEIWNNLNDFDSDEEEDDDEEEELDDSDNQDDIDANN